MNRFIAIIAPLMVIGSASFARPIWAAEVAGKHAFSRADLSFEYEDPWQLTQTADGSIELRTFAAYAEADAIPPEGGVITVGASMAADDSVFSPNTPLQDSSQVVTVDGRAGTKISASETLGAISYVETTLRVPVGPRLYQIALKYRNSPQEDKITAAFDRFLSSLHFR